MLLGRSSRLGDMRNEVLDSRRSTPPSGRGVAIAGGGPGRTVKEHCLYTVIGNVSVTTRSVAGNSWNRGAGEAVGRHGPDKLLIKDSGLEGW